MSGLNYYQLLSVPRDASPDEIRRAYVRHVKHIHPDLVGVDWRPAATLQDLQRAYRCLLDPDARRSHDAQLADFDAAHAERLRRVERRLAERRRRLVDGGTRRPVSSGRKRRIWWLALLVAATILLVMKLRLADAI